jgi:hypothetical protein
LLISKKKPFFPLWVLRSKERKGVRSKEKREGGFAKQGTRGR